MSKRTFRPIAAIAAGCLALLLTGGLATVAPASAATQTFDTPVFGGYDWVVPAGVTTATFDLDGGSGAGVGGSIGGKGGETVATIAVTPGETLNVNVGGTAPPPGSGSGLGGGGRDLRSVRRAASRASVAVGAARLTYDRAAPRSRTGCSSPAPAAAPAERAPASATTSVA